MGQGLLGAGVAKGVLQPVVITGCAISGGLQGDQTDLLAWWQYPVDGFAGCAKHILGIADGQANFDRCIKVVVDNQRLSAGMALLGHIDLAVDVLHHGIAKDNNLSTGHALVGIGGDTVGIGVLIDIAGQRQGADQQEGWQ